LLLGREGTRHNALKALAYVHAAAKGKPGAVVARDALACECHAHDTELVLRGFVRSASRGGAHERCSMRLGRAANTVVRPGARTRRLVVRRRGAGVCGSLRSKYANDVCVLAAAPRARDQVGRLKKIVLSPPPALMLPH
jgi:hypothetical protein